MNLSKNNNEEFSLLAPQLPIKRIFIDPMEATVHHVKLTLAPTSDTAKVKNPGSFCTFRFPGLASDRLENYVV
jgi:hypothetical protein